MAYPQPAAPTYVQAPPGADPTAVFGRRVLAFVIDGLVVGVPGVAIMTSQFEYLDADTLGMDAQDFCDRYMEDVGGFCANTADINDRVYFADNDDLAGPGFAFWGLSFLLAVLLQGVTGWTIGKLVAGIRTVREDGRPAGIGKAFVRWLLWIVDGQPCGLPLVGFITALTSKGHRRVGDMAAKTFVVRASAMGSPITVPGLATDTTGYAAMTYGTTPPPWSPAPPSEPGAPGWAAPGAAAPPSAPSATGPQWDAARGTYIQWDATQSRWLQWDERAQAWTPIPGQ